MPAIMPVRTSPVPPFAIAGEPVGLIHTCHRETRSACDSLSAPGRRCALARNARASRQPSATFATDQPGHLAGMRRQNGLLRRVRENLCPRSSSGRRRRSPSAPSTSLSSRSTSSRFAEPGPDGDHGLSSPARNRRAIPSSAPDQPTRPTHATVTRPAPARSAASPDIAAAPDFPRRAADHQHMPEIAFVRIALSRREQRAQNRAVRTTSRSDCESSGGMPMSATISLPTLPSPSTHLDFRRGEGHRDIGAHLHRRRNIHRDDFRLRKIFVDRADQLRVALLRPALRSRCRAARRPRCVGVGDRELLRLLSVCNHLQRRHRPPAAAPPPIRRRRCCLCRKKSPRAACAAARTRAPKPRPRACPAFSISTSPGVPRSIVSRSASRICFSGQYFHAAASVSIAPVFAGPPARPSRSDDRPPRSCAPPAD